MVSEYRELSISLVPGQGWVCQGLAYNPTPNGSMVLTLDFRGSNAVVISATGTVATLPEEVQYSLVNKILNDVVDALVKLRSAQTEVV